MYYLVIDQKVYKNVSNLPHILHRHLRTQSSIWSSHRYPVSEKVLKFNNGIFGIDLQLRFPSNIVPLKEVMSSSSNPGEGTSAAGQGGSASGARLYPPDDEQLCHHCVALKKEDCKHEAKDCTVKADSWGGLHCPGCGHGDHLERKKCPLNPKVKGKEVPIPLEKFEQMTPSMRIKHRKWGPTTVPDRTVVQAPKTPPKPPSPKSPKTPDSTAKSNSGNSSQNAPSTPMKRNAVSPETQKAYDDAEKLMPRPKTVKKNLDTGDEVLANFFKIALTKGTILHKYSITLGDMFEKRTPEAGKPEFERKLSRETKRYLVQELLNANPPAHAKWACDYDSTIISSEPLYPKSTQIVGQVTETPHTRSPRKVGDPRPTVNSQVTYIGLVDVEGLLNHVKGNDDNYVSVEQLRALNIISWKRINENSFQGGLVGKKFYPSELLDKAEEAANKLNPTKCFMIRKGFYSSMRPGVGSVLLNVNTTTSAFYAPIRLSTWLNLFWKDDVDRIRAGFRSYCKSLRVTFDIHKERSRKWIICEISPDDISNTFFPLDKVSNKTSSVKAYIDKTYGTNIAAKGYCINVGTATKKIWYPADLLTIVDWQVVSRVLPGDHGAEMVLRAERMPGQHKDLIEKTALSYLGLDPRTTFYKDFKMVTVNTFMKVAAKKVSAPKLIFKGDNAVVKGSWYLNGAVRFLKGAGVLNRLCIISFCKQGALGPTNLAVLKTGLTTWGIKAENVKDLSLKPVLVAEPDAGETYRTLCQERLKSAYQSFKDPKFSDPQIILVVLENHNIPLYAEIKRWGDCPDLAANVCLKINAKLRGISHSVDLKSTVPLGTMIVGADCTHPGDQAQERPSIAGIVATSDDSSFHYLASARLQTSKQEYIEDLRSMIKERVRVWYNSMKANTKRPVEFKTSDHWLPKRILFYRDGVSESQYGMVRHQELPQILAGCVDAFNEIKAGDPRNHAWNGFKYKPLITLIVVTKRHHSRFYDKSTIPSSKENLPPGTVVDTDVVTPNHVNFYLQAHESPKGTARSSHYTVLEDMCKYDMKKLQEMTNKISYTGARATKALSVCTPAQYADFLCDRLRCYMKPAYDGKYPKEPDKYDKSKKTSTKASPPGKGKGKAVEDTKTVVKADAVTRIDQSPEDYAGDSHLWLPPGPAYSGAPVRKNPWAPALDNIMFYI
ncbi:hypothetical protein VTL71DRAFT_6989 [Oculimacula yallundae]|uniref:Piwi domain-containing protein n=1 Tax=Oculimacula yallundae TaxID=86028 RepID=A0ABR4BVE2_9HELO